jgi:hypothetical protein
VPGQEIQGFYLNSNVGHFNNNSKLDNRSPSANNAETRKRKTERTKKEMKSNKNN